MIFDPEQYIKPYKDEANATIPSTIIAELNKAYTLTPEQEEAALKELSPVFDDNDLSWLNLFSNLSKLLSNYTDKLNKQTLNALKSETALQTNLKDNQMQSARMEQEAETSQKKPEPKADDTEFSSVVDNPDADNSLVEDYPNTTGFVTEVGDYVKINNKQKSIFLVHNSGTRLAIDQSGNVTIYSSGSMKIKADASLAIAVNGGLDISATDGVFIHGSELKLKSDGDFKLESQKIDAEGSNGIELKGMKMEVKDAMQVKFPDAMMAEFGGMGKFQMMVSAAGFANG